MWFFILTTGLIIADIDDVISHIYGFIFINKTDLIPHYKKKWPIIDFDMTLIRYVFHTNGGYC